ncbi:MAG: efflux RND transporter periplasmic adaptor subunit [Pseudomonadota bacterium]
MSTKKTVLLAGALLATAAAGIGLGWWLKERAGPAHAPAPQQERKILYYRNPMDPSITSPVPKKDEMGMDYLPVYAEDAEAPKRERRILYYRNPMNPAITSDKPMKDEMGMDYLPVYAEEGAQDDSGVIRIDPRVVQNLGVRTAPASRQRFGRAIDTVGTVAVDEHRVTFLNPKISGWLERLHARAVGDVVRPGQVLAEIYSPELVSAQEEYLVALRGAARLRQAQDARLDAESQALVQAARERLRLLDLPPAEIRALERRGTARRTTPLRAPHGGVITELNAREGSYVGPDTRIVSLADLSRVWVNVEIYAEQLPWVKAGDPVTLRIPGLPGRQWQGRIDYLYPTLNAQSRTVQARLAFPNPDGVLRPGMYANAHVAGNVRDNVLTVPREALIRTGERTLVILALGEGRFRPAPVRTGAESGDAVEILEGVQEGQRVVTSGQFLLDAEASLQGALNRLQGGEQPAVDGGQAAGGHGAH